MPMATTASETDPRTWWTREGLEVRDGCLLIAGRDAASLVREQGSPLYAYDVQHIAEQIRAVQQALAVTGLRYRVRLAIKAQREPEILAAVRSLGAAGEAGSVGLDVCSPGEVQHGLANGWLPSEVSLTGTNLSDTDLDAIIASGVHVNVDLVTQLERFGRRRPGGRVGVRVNPRAGAAHAYVPVGASPESELRFGVYGGEKPTKFGIYPEQLDDALAVARRHELIIDTVHFHISHQLLNEDLPAYDGAVAKSAAMVRRLQDAGCPIEEVNAGGGLGTPWHAGDEPLDLRSWAGILARHLGPLDVTVGSEPGEFFTKHAGVLLAEVVTVEERLGTTFVGLAAGWNVMPLRFVWGEFVELVHCTAADAPRTRRVTVSGHINEAPDLFAEDYPLPPTDEGDVLAVLGVGGYCQAVATEHCLRPTPKTIFFTDRLRPVG
jgi:diaminopimelate decarboxylase